MVDPVDRLWALIDPPWIDPAALRAAVESVPAAPDRRTATLLEEARQALRGYDRRITTPPPGVRFPYLWNALMEPTDPKKVQQLLRELGETLSSTHTLRIGDSIVLIWRGILSRHTQDLDSVDDVPEPVWQAAWDRDIERRYGLKLTAFQSHFLPEGWQGRLRDQGMYGNLHVQLVDPLDILTSKLFSRRNRDLDDLRVITARWSEREVAVWRTHVLSHSRSLRTDPELERTAQRNWRILQGSDLFEDLEDRTATPG
jgi:hypothetical protein